MTDTVLGWWFSAGRRLRHGDGRRIAVGKTHHVKGEIVPHRKGLHLYPDILDALEHASGPILWRVRGAGEIIRDGGKVTCSARTYLAGGVDVSDASDALCHFTRLCALDMADLWGAKPATKRFLRTAEPAYAAAYAATYVTATITANATTRTVYDAIRARQSRRLLRMVRAALKLEGEKP